MLRPEFVRKNSKPLSSDAFSSWFIENSEEHNEEVRKGFEIPLITISPFHYSRICEMMFSHKKATKRLEEQIVAEHAEQLLRLYISEDSGNAQLSTEESKKTNREYFDRLTEVLHRSGINVRYLGMVRSCILNRRESNNASTISRYLLTEITARTAKNILRARMRALKSPDDSQYRKLILAFFNLLFSGIQMNEIDMPDIGGRSAWTQKDFWCKQMKSSITKRFQAALTFEELSDNLDLRSRLNLSLLFERFQVISGVTISTAESINPSNSGYMLQFSEWDIREIAATEKSIHRVFFEEGTALAAFATKASEGAEQLFKLADEKYKQTLTIKPDDYRTLHNWGLSLSLQAMKKLGSPTEASALFKLAEQKFEAALVINNRDDRALFLWGNMLSEQATAYKESAPKDALAMLETASCLYDKSFAINPRHFGLLYNWGSSMLYRANILSAQEKASPYMLEFLLMGSCEKYRLAIELKPQSAKAHLNWGVALSKLAQIKHKKKDNEVDVEALWTAAEEKLRICSEIKQEHEVFFNWGNVLFKRGLSVIDQLESRDSWTRKVLLDRHVELLKDAGYKYLLSLDANPQYYDSLYNWGKLLYHQFFSSPDSIRLSNFVSSFSSYLMVYQAVASMSMF